MRVLLPLGIAIVVLPWFAGCAAAPASPSGAAPKSASVQNAPAAEKKMSALRKGMTADEVRAAWGAPEKIAPMESPEGTAEVWTYETSIFSGVREMQKGVMTEMRRNPNTGMDEATSVPVMGMEQIYIDRTIELLIFDAKLVEWKQTDKERRTYR